MPRNRLLGFGLAVGLGTLFVGFPQRAEAGLIADRATLDALLGPTAVTEDFERFQIGFGDAVNLDVATLDSSTIANGQGPGLVVPGVRFVSSSQLQWNGPGWFGQPSKDLLSNSGDSTLLVDFTAATSAFGLELLSFTGFPDTAMVTIYASDDATVLATFSGIPVAGEFFGFTDPGGIGGARLTGVFPWSPIIDNLEFGRVTAVPEPSSLLMTTGGILGLALLRRRRSR